MQNILRRFLFPSILLLGTVSFAQFPNTLSGEEKVYGLSKFWQEVNYNFVYLDQVDRERWNQDYTSLIAEVQQTENDYQYYRLLERFCATLKDGHTNVYMPRAIQDSIYRTNFGAYRLFLENIDGKAIVTRTNLSIKDKIPVGSELIQVNGMSTNEYIDLYVKPYISSSTSHILDDWAVYNIFKSPVGTSYEVSFKLPDGTTKDLTLTHELTEEKDVYPPFPEDWSLLEFDWVDEDENIAHVALNGFSKPKIDTLFRDHLPELKKAKALIIDLRYNGGGSTTIGLEILKHLTNDTVLYGSQSHSRMHIPTYKAWGNWVEVNDTAGDAWSKKSFLYAQDQYYYTFDYTPDTIRGDFDRIVVPTVILIGHNTASAAEDFLIYADNQEHMTLIGEPTFGSTGQPMMFDLPGGGSARICTKKDTYPDGRPFVGIGIQPDIYVSKTLEDYIEDRDPALEKSINFLK